MTVSTDARPRVGLLVAEDSEIDRMLLTEAFSELNFDVELIFVGDGEELLEYLRLRGPNCDTTLFRSPALILMDLNMPRMNGLAALKILRADASMRVLPVIVLSTSSDPKQIIQAYAHGINAYLAKPEGIEDMVDTVRRFGDFWLGPTKLPDPTLLL